MKQVYVCLHNAAYVPVYTPRVGSTPIAEIGPPRDFSKVSGAKIAKPVNLEFRRRDSPPTVANSYDSGAAPGERSPYGRRIAHVDSKNTSYSIPSDRADANVRAA